MKIIKIKYNKNFQFFLLSILFNNILNNDCNRTNPILKDNNCQLIYCNENQFLTEDCIVNNNIIKTQWLTRINRISKENYRYINIAKNTKGDIFIETSPITEGSTRVFLGLKANGRPYFKKNSNKEETPFYIMNEMSRDLKRHESELINIVLNNDEKDEYLMSI